MRRSSGFTLIEVMISGLILAFVIAGISGVIVAQGQASVTQVQQRDIESNARLAAMEIARSIRMAGYGINPLAAFDFDRYGCTTPGTSTTCPNGGRDRIAGPDELVVSWRDPLFSRNATTIAGSGPWTVTLNTALTAALTGGRIVQMLCLGAEPSVYLALNGDTAVGATQLVLRALVPADGYYTGLTTAGALNTTPSNTCFGTATVMLVERVRYFIANDTDGTSSLFKERGRGANELLYRNIEDLQFQYTIGPPPTGFVAPQPACGGTSWIFGSCATAGTPPESAAAPVWISDNYVSLNRYTGHPANIRNVDIFVVGRASLKARDNTAGDGVPLLGNRPARPADGYHRTVVGISEQPMNLLGRAHFLPPVYGSGSINDPNSGNAGGG